MFNNREFALFTWIGVLILWFLIKRSRRESLKKLLTVALSRKLATIYLAILIYTVAMTFLFYKTGQWDKSQIKNTVFWFLTVGLVSLFDINSDKQGNRLKKTFRDIFGVTAIVQFIVGVYSFSYWIELFLLPFLILLSATLTVAGQDAKHNEVKKLLNGILSATGFFLIGYAVFKVITDFGSFANKGNLGDFLTPALLSFLYLPFIYLLSLFVFYDDLLAGFDKVIKKPSLRSYAKWKAMLVFKANKTEAKRWRTLLFLKKVTSQKHVDKSISFIKKCKDLEENPPPVDISNGWSPYAAKDFLAQEGIITGFYMPVYENEWSAFSPYVDLGGELINNNIAYYVTGDNQFAKDLNITINVNSPEFALSAHKKLLFLCEMLFKQAMDSPLPKQISKGIYSGIDGEFIIDEKIISLLKNKWEGHKLNGYSFSFIIKTNPQTSQQKMT